MPAIISNTTFGSGVLTAAAFSMAVSRAANEGFLISISYEGDFGAPSAISGVRWDSATDNQAFTQVGTPQQSGATNRWLAVYHLASPASVKASNITVTFTAATNVDRLSVLARHVTGHDTATMVRSSAKSSGLISNGVPQSTVTPSAVGDLVIGFLAYRNETAYLSAAAGQNDVVKFAHAAAISRTTASSSKPGDTSVTTGWASNDPTGYDYAHIVSSVQPAAATVPGAPTIGTATAGAGSASVPFTAPASSGSSAILDFTVTSSLGEVATVTASPANFTGLSVAARTFTVVARNGAGTGPASAASNSVTPTAANVAPTFTGTIANIAGTGGTAITPVNVSGFFTDTAGDTRTFTAAPGVAWPTGLIINASTGVISGTVATGTTTGIKVRATDAGGLFVDSNAFNATFAAPASTVTGVTVTPATLSAAGGSSGTLSATVVGTGTPSQAVNWAITAGSISAAGAYVLPAATAASQTVTATATSAQDGTKSGTCVFTIAALATVTFTCPLPLGRAASGAARAGVVVRVSVLPITGNSDTPVAVFGSNLTLSSTGVPPPFSVSGVASGARHPVKYTNIADPLDYCICNLTAV